jgi:hypothetical protein
MEKRPTPVDASQRTAGLVAISDLLSLRERIYAF